MAVTLIGRVGTPIGAEDQDRVEGVLGDLGLVVRSRRPLRVDGAAREVIAEPPAGRRCPEVREAVLDVVGDRLDVAVQPDTPARRTPGYVFFDMDSTLVEAEVIDELARLHGVYAEVAEVTARAMAGELDYEASLRARVAVLAGLAWSRVEAMVDALPVTAGAAELVATLRAIGARTAVLSGGFQVAAEPLRRRLGLDRAFANRLEVAEGRLTGRVLAPVVTPARKAELLAELAAEAGTPLARTVAVGDGANDLLMLGRAGLGVAFHAKPAVVARADASIRRGPLDLLLHLFGYTDTEGARLRGA